MSSTSHPTTTRRSTRPRTILTGLALAALPVPVLLSACTSAEPQGEAARVGEAEQLLTQCVTFQRGAGGTVSDAMLSFPPGDKNYGTHPLLRTGKKDQSLLWFDLSTIPEGAVIDSATLKLYTNGATGDTVSLHAATAAWSESTVTYNSFANQYAPAVVGLIQPSSPNALKTVNLTSLVSDWVTGAKVNSGVLLKGTQNPPTYFWSSDSDKPALRPALEVCFTTPDNHCDPDPCQNGATCVNNPTDYTCDCAPGWTGTNCETEIDECAANPCVHGQCTDVLNGYTCACAPGWTGTNCDIDIDECASSPCQNGVCTDLINAYQCDCDPGFTGTNCETNIDECAPENPCLNGGACTDGVNGYSCACATGYTGANCEENIDDCPGNQCQNGSACLDGVASYSCICPPGYTGAYCEIDIDECAPENPCLNGGTCNDGVNGYSCACEPGYTGANCEIDINECESSPCVNGGLCVDQVNAYECQCLPGWTGTNCETFVPCALEPCQNGGACVPTENAAGYVCACPIGWTGQDCDVQWDICASNLCQNGGTCEGEPGEQSCVCPTGFDGPFCEQVIYDCVYDNPCTPTGTTTYFPTDKGPDQYIECSAGGECSQMTCPAGDKWDQSTLSCVTPTTCPCDANAGWSQVNALPNGLIVTSSDPSNGSEARAYLTQGDPTYLGMGLLLPEDGVTMSYFDTNGGSNDEPVGACFIMSRPLQSYYAAWLTSTEAALCNAQIDAANTTNTPVPDVPVPMGLFGAGALGLAEIARRVIRRRSR